MGCCRKNSSDYQRLPSTGPLARRCNYSIDYLLRSISHGELSATVYYYVMSTVSKHNGTLHHYGCGPNWQGAVITLCTCKHFMRNFREVEDWRGTWIAGFSNVHASAGKNVLMYMMRVSRAFESHYDLWYALPRQVKSAKATDKNKLGDIYRPLGWDTKKAQFIKSKYHRPCPSHNHVHDWHKDINYKKYRRAALLEGDKEHSFIWNQGNIIFYPNNIGRGQRKDNLKAFLYGHLREASQRKR